MATSYSIPDLTAELDRATPDEHGLRCLKRSLHAAIQLEFATIPPYLTAYWSTIDPAAPNAPNPAGDAIREIVVEEMGHMGLACNLLVGLGESPDLAAPGFVPSYPGPLPGHVHPGLEVPLRRLTPSQLKVFMDIEQPDFPAFPELAASAARSFGTIGAFYAALRKAFQTVAPRHYETSKQRDESSSGVFQIERLDGDKNSVYAAIDQIRHQGEGSPATPKVGDTRSELAHFYRFREVYVGAQYVPDPVTGVFGHTGPLIPMPAVRPMADIPRGGYKRADVPDQAVWALVELFDRTFSLMLRQLTLAWSDPNAPLGDFSADDPVSTMGTLRTIALDLMTRKRPDNVSVYGPSFRLV